LIMAYNGALVAAAAGLFPYFFHSLSAYGSAQSALNATYFARANQELLFEPRETSNTV